VKITLKVQSSTILTTVAVLPLYFAADSEVSPCSTTVEPHVGSCDALAWDFAASVLLRGKKDGGFDADGLPIDQNPLSQSLSQSAVVSG
jgi:hypothetical protein